MLAENEGGIRCCLKEIRKEDWTLKGVTGQYARKVKLRQVVLTWADLSEAKIWMDPAYQRQRRYLAMDHGAVAQERKMQDKGIKRITGIWQDKSDRSVSVATFDTLLPTGADLVVVESSGQLPPFTAENVRTMVGKHASVILTGPDTGSWVLWMMSLAEEITNWHVHTFPFSTSTDDRMWDPKNPRKMLYRNLRISMVTEQKVPETRQTNYVTSTVPWRLWFLSFLIRAVSISMRKPESERSKTSILYAFHERHDTGLIAEILALMMCGMPRWSLKVVCPSTVPLNTLATKVKEEVKEVEATGFVGNPEEDRMWVTGVPLTYTALAQFNKAYVQNERHRDKVARTAEIKDAKADAKSKSKKRSEEEIKHNEENQDNAKKKKQRSGDKKQSTAHEPGAQSSTNKERQSADHERAVPASPAETAKTTTSERATTPSSVSSARATNDSRGDLRPPTPSSRPSATPLTDTERKTSEEAQGQKMLEDNGSEADGPQGTMDDESRNDGDGESSQKSESSDEPRCTLRVNEKRPRYTQPPPAEQICIPRSGAAQKSKDTGGREAEPMEPKGRREPPPTLQEVNAVINKIYKNS